jgi:glycosyltransferase involved in cell wall biosynthesis
MKIFLLANSLSMGGAEKVVVSLADAFVEKGHEVRIAYLTGTALVLPRNKNVQVFNLGIISKIDGFKAIFKLNKLIRDFQPDVVHSHMVHANIFARLVRLLTPMPFLISTAHSSNEGGKLRMLAYRLTDKLADLSTNVSSEAVNAFVAKGAVSPGRMMPVSNGIDTEHFFLNRSAGRQLSKQMGVNPDVKIILAVGRLTKAKDYPNLLRAYSRLDHSLLRTELWIVGEGELRLELENLVIMLGLSERIRFLGVRHDMPHLMSAADVFVLSSAWEGFGLVVAEAMACQRVVVATDCGGVKEVLGDTGYMVRPKDSAALALALQSALHLPSEQSTILGRRARQRVVELYGLNAVVDKWLQIYKRKYNTI